MTLEVSQKGRIKSAFIPRDINESEIRKKWLNCITKQTFKLRFPELVKEKRYNWLVSVDPSVN